MNNYRRTKAYERFSEYLSKIQNLDLCSKEGKEEAINAARDLLFAYNPFKYYQTKLETKGILEQLKNEL